MTPVVVQQVVKEFRQPSDVVTALAGVDLRVEKGDFLAIMGASGSGKSTLLHLMAGLTTPTAGSVAINGHELSNFNDRQLTIFRRKNIGLVFQSFNLIPTLTAAENVALPLRLDGQKEADIQHRVAAAVKRMNIQHRADHRPDAMSGGEQQRVAIARALVTQPAVLLADEPTGNLDSANSERLCALLAELAAHDGMTIVMVTHEPTVAAYARRVAFIRDGRMVDLFSMTDLDSPRDLAPRYLAAMATPAPGSAS